MIDSKKHECLVRRAKEIVEDKWCNQLVYMVGRQNGITDTKKVDKIKKTQEFINMVIRYLEN